MKKFKLDVSEDGEAAYLYLPNYPDGNFRVSKTVRLLNLIDYPGPDLMFDFDSKGELIGIEILLDE